VEEFHHMLRFLDAGKLCAMSTHLQSL